MTVNELIERLQEFDGDAEVRLGIQQSYPFQNRLSGVVSAEQVAQATHDHDENHWDEHEADEAREPVQDFDGPVADNTVYLLEGSQLGYFDKAAWMVNW